MENFEIHNLNDVVYFQLSTDGYAIVKEYIENIYNLVKNVDYNKYVSDVDDSYNHFINKTKEIDGEIYIQTMFWEFCNIFGKYFYMGAAVSPIINNKIIFEKSLI